MTTMTGCGGGCTSKGMCIRRISKDMLEDMPKPFYHFSPQQALTTRYDLFFSTLIHSLAMITVTHIYIGGKRRRPEQNAKDTTNRD